MSIYTLDWFAASRPGMQRAAAAVVPVALDVLDRSGWNWPARVVDVGCGEGWWALEFAHQCSADVVGVDGSYVDSPLGDRFVAHDLEQMLPDLGSFDLAVCLEVAEHLTPERAESFIADLCRLAPVVLFSAAIPGQGGQGHINCQWPSYWARLFEKNDFGLDDSIRWRIWDDPAIPVWYRQNLHLAIKGVSTNTHDVVHPRMLPELR